MEKIWVLKDLETGYDVYFTDYGFISELGITLKNFKQRWKAKKTKGLCFGNQYYVSEDIIWTDGRGAIGKKE